MAAFSHHKIRGVNWVAGAIVALQVAACSQPQRTTARVPASNANPKYEQNSATDRYAQQEAERLRREADARRERECTTEKCDKVRFSYTIAQGESPDIKGSLSAYSDTATTWSLTPAPDINIGNREFKFKVTGAPSDSKIISDTKEIRIIVRAGSEDAGTLQIIARDMDYCLIEKESDKNIDCNDFDNARSRDDEDQISFEILDKRDIPETAQEREDRLRKEEERKLQRQRTGNAIGCIAQKGSDALGAGNQIGDLIGTIAGAVSGGTGRGCNSN